MKKLGLIIAPLALVVVLLTLTFIPASAALNPGDQPINKYSFRVEIDGVDAGQFLSVEGLSIEQEVIEYQNGDDPLTRTRPGRVKYGEITLTKEYTAATVLNDWIEAARCGNGDYTRKNMSIIMTDQSNNPIKRWNCFECFPTSWEISTLSSQDNDILTEEIVIIIEWFEEA